MALIKKAQEAGLNFGEQFRIKKALLSAEPLPTALRQEIESYGIAVANAYATAEFGIMAMDTTGNMQMQLFPDPIIQIVDPETGLEVESGTPGEVVVTNFNRHYPLIRFGTGDMAINVDPNPGQSKQEERFITLIGRSGEAAKVRGMFVHPNQLRFVAAQMPGITAVQGVVSRTKAQKDYFTLRIELADGVAQTVDEETAVTTPFTQAIQSVCRVRVNELQVVPPGTITADSPGMIDEREWN
jgi:phenylacetate-CoA ligase